jgi:epoxyqueuosine reductase QueG
VDHTLRQEIEGFVLSAPANRLPNSDIPLFDPPLVGVAAGDDPLFLRYKEVVGPFHLTPAELFAAEFGDMPAVGSVIVWVLPISEPVRASNRPETEFPSRQWSQVRTFGEELNRSLRLHLVQWLTARGHRALAPQLSPLWQEFSDTPVGIASSWSERHAAYAAGLGTFSLNDGFITEVGMALRIGSVVTDLVLPPTPRTAPHYRWNCLFHRDGSCGACIGRCPVGALSREGHDKALCSQHVYGTIHAAVAAKYGVTATGCGLCQTRVPCEGRIP